MTFSPGDIYWERFGHNALLVRDERGGAWVYNYGIFDFRQKNFFLNFARGHMLYRLDRDSLRRTAMSYASEGRWIYEQRLALTELQRQALAGFLSWNAQPENAEYRYDYFLSNCSTRVRDALDQATGGALKRQLQLPTANGATFRSEVTRLMAPEWLMAVGMDLGLGPGVDRPLTQWQHGFIPMELMKSVRGVRVAGDDGIERPLVAAEGYLLSAERVAEPEQAPQTFWPFFAVGFIVALLLIALAAVRHNPVARGVLATLAMLFFALAAILGLVLAAGWGLTEHWGMWANQNLLLLNPLALLLIPIWAGAFRRGWRPGSWALRITGLVALLALSSLALKPLLGVQHNAAWIALLLPVHLALATISWRAGRRAV